MTLHFSPLLLSAEVSVLETGAYEAIPEFRRQELAREAPSDHTLLHFPLLLTKGWFGRRLQLSSVASVGETPYAQRLPKDVSLGKQIPHGSPLCNATKPGRTREEEPQATVGRTENRRVYLQTKRAFVTQKEKQRRQFLLRTPAQAGRLPSGTDGPDRVPLLPSPSFCLESAGEELTQQRTFGNKAPRVQPREINEYLATL